MPNLEAMLSQSKAYRAAAATAPNRRIYELLLELAAEFQYVADRVDASAKAEETTRTDGRFPHDRR
jgi:hypothetical protein